VESFIALRTELTKLCCF